MEETVKLSLDRAKAKRKTLRQITTKNMNKIIELLQSESVDAEELEECSENLQEKADLIFQLDLEIEKLIPELKDFESEVASNQEYRERITKVKTKVKKYFRDRKIKSDSKRDETEGNSSDSKKAETEENAIKESNTVTAVKSDTNVNPKVHLPKLRIEPFDGDFERFQEFWAQFESAIHDNSDLSKVDKYNYLKTVLKGRALMSIQGLVVSDKNYDVAVNLLKERYGREEILVRAHVNRLLNLNPVRSTSQLVPLRELSDQIEIEVRGLENFGIELKSYGNLLFPLLLKLIPDSIALDFNRTHEKEDSWDVEKLLKFLKKEIETRERTFLFRHVGENKTQSDSSLRDNEKPQIRHFNAKGKFQRPYEKRRELIPSASALNVLGESCLFCGSEEHKSEVCTTSVSEKIKSLKRNGRCFLCLRKNHVASACNSKNRCSKCSRRHNSLLCCGDSYKHAEVRENHSPPDSPPAEESVNYMNGKQQRQVMLQTARGEIGGHKLRKGVRILFDLGATRTFIKQNISRQMKLPVIDSEIISVYAFGKEKPQIEKRNKVRFALSNPFDRKIKFTIEAFETELITGTSIDIPRKNILRLCDKRGIKLSDTALFEDEDEEFSLLIGADYYWKIVTGAVERISDTLVAVDTRLGWTVSGTESAEISAGALNIMQNLIQVKDKREDDSVSELLKNLFELDILGIESESGKNPKSEDEVYKRFRESVKFENNRYTVSLPWKENTNKLNNNYDVAKNRFQSLWRRFIRNPELHDRYEKVIEKHLQEGIAEIVENNRGEREYFLPHQAVIRENKDTTKLRVVYDASSHAEGCLSLNDCLEPGPNLCPEVLKLLLNFRQNKIGITADIEAAFLQISLEEKDRNAVKFLWRRRDLDELQILRMTRVIFGAKSSPFLLNATLKVHIEKYESQYPEECAILNNCLYVDDLITGDDTKNEVIRKSENIKKMLKDGSFNMRKWATNDSSVQEVWDRNENNILSPVTKVLGYVWDKKKDVLRVEVSGLEYKKCDDEASKREVLKLIGRLFDPLGLISPFTVRARILLQKIWKDGLQWDEGLPQEVLVEWNKWRKEVPEIEKIRISRYYFGNNEKRELINCQLHCFVDASEKAYGAVIYLRYQDETTIQSRLMCSKARVAPLKHLSLPRLELMAALIGVRLSKTVRSCLSDKIQVTPYFWSDSNIALHWIRGSPEKWKQFVQNRVREILAKSEPETWRYCPTKENPADFTTRGLSVEELNRKQEWWLGPKWLTEIENNWPKMPQSHRELDVQNERKGGKKALQVICIDESNDSKLFNLEKFSTLSKVVRVTAWVKRFLKNVKSEEKQTGPLTHEELKSAEFYWIRTVQREHFSREVQYLKNGKPLPKESTIGSFNPFLDNEQILRVGGRLHNAELSFSERHPILLPKNAYLSELITKHSHEKIGHAGIAGTISQIREQYWLVKGRQMVKSILRRCIICQRFKSKPLSQEIAPLPPDRVKKTFPFEVVGIDFAGPLHTKNSGKAYIALFTCAVTRALHLELMHDLSTKSFLLAFRKFLARRGLCSTVYTDNAKTFKRADKDLRKLWISIKDPEVHNYFGKQGITWKYIVERAAWWGGFWERLVRSVKSCLKKLLGRASLPFEELETVLHEAEAMVNSRPLTYVYEDHNEPYALTPAHFLIGRRMLTLPTAGTASDLSTREVLTKRYVKRQVMIERLWKTWKHSYLLELRSAHTAKRPEGSPQIHEGSIVLIHDDKRPRLMWKMARVEQLHEGRDAKVRSCTLKLPSGSATRRAIQHLYPLELEYDRTSTRPSGAGGCCEQPEGQSKTVTSETLALLSPTRDAGDVRCNRDARESREGEESAKQLRIMFK